MCVYDLFRASRPQPLRLNCAVLFVAVFGLLFFAPSRPAHGQCPEYEITATVQGPECQFGGPPPTVGEGINDLGHICGWYNVCTVGNSVPFYWTPETGLVTLDMPQGAYEGTAQDISNDGLVVGYYMTDGGTRGFVWDDGEWTELAPEGDGHAGAYAINNNNQVTGYRDIDGLRHAFIWEDGEFIHDIAPTYGDQASGRDINDNAQVTGVMRNSLYDQHAFLWENGDMTDIGPVPGGVGSVGQGINEAGYVTGYGHIQRNGEVTFAPGFLWNGEYIMNIEGLDGFNLTFGLDVNQSNQIVGFSRDSDNPNNNQAFIWENGIIRNLNNFVSTDFYIDLTRAHDINNSGQITGKGNTNDVVAIVLNPIPNIPGDLTCDGYVDGSDLDQLLMVWESDDDYADLSGDGVVNGADLGLLLGYWNPDQK